MWAIVFLASTLALQGEASPTYGPWMVILNKVGPCTDKIYQDVGSELALDIEKSGKIGRTVVGGSFNFTNGVSNDAQVSIQVHEFKKGSWNVIIGQKMGSACEAFSKYSKLSWQLLMDHSNLTQYEENGVTCLKPGYSGLTEPFPFQPITMDHIQSFFYGIYRLDIIMLHSNDTVYSCSSFYTKVVPKTPTG